MNEIKLNGIITNISPSHTINNTEYSKAQIINRKTDGYENVLNLRFKTFSNPYKEGDKVELSGNLRSYSKQLDNGKSKVDIYVFTYFDIPKNVNDQEYINEVEIDGRICKIDKIRKTHEGKDSIHYILANNIIVENKNQKLNSYLPIVAYDDVARRLSELKVNDKIAISGQLHSREFKKRISEDDFEIHVAHEIIVRDFKVIE